VAGPDPVCIATFQYGRLYLKTFRRGRACTGYGLTGRIRASANVAGPAQSWSSLNLPTISPPGRSGASATTLPNVQWS
jgi:hypothetical protein